MKKATLLLISLFIGCSAFAQEDDWDVSVNLWHGGFEKTDWEIVVGYVNKSWINSYPSGTYREDFFGDSGKLLNGFQIGGLYTPSFDWGLGLRTGILFEFYLSRSDIVRYFGWSNYTEADLYIPLHASFRIPFTERSCVSIFGGMGFQLAMGGYYNKSLGIIYPGWYRRPCPWVVPARYGYSVKQEFGYGWPQQVNWQAECGLDFQFGMIGITLSYAFGITDHGIQNSFDDGATYITASPSRQDKMNFAVSFAF